MGCFSCFKPSSASTRHDPSAEEDPFEADTKRAMEISRNEEEDRIRRQKREEDQQIEIKRAKEKAEQDEEKRRIEESKEEGKRKQVEDTGQIKNSKDHVEGDVNPSPSICNGCNSAIKDGISVNAFGEVWHPQCLCCLHCHKPISAEEISNSKGKFHRSCYKEHRHPNCYVCKNKIPSTEEGIKFHEHPFWKEKYCPFHDTDGTAKCCSCERLEPRGTNFVMLGDDRWLCLECMDSSVMDTYECHSLHLEIREFFEGLFFKVDKEFPLLLVEKQALNKAEEEEKIDYHHAKVTRGLCLSEEQVVISVKERPVMGSNHKLIVVTESQTVSGCEVTAILIIYGLPRLLTGYILAHEMMHAWLRLNGYRNLKLELEEGLCQVLGLRWLESQAFASADADAAAASSSRTPPAATTSKKGEDWSDFEKKLVDFCIYQIKEDDSRVYGRGFKQVNEILVSNHYNLKDTLKEIVSASKF